MEDEQIPEADLIDDAIAALIDEMIGEEGDIEEFDAASDVVLDIMEDLANSDQIQDPPEQDEPEELKQKWLEQYFPIVKAEIHKALHDGFIGEPDGDSNLAL